MRVVLDTSVLVASILADHVHHERAIWWLAVRPELELCASWHAMAETWATLTRIPIAAPIAPSAAGEVVARLETRLRMLQPSPKVYREAIRRCSGRGVRSGVIFDALHLVAA